MSRIYKFTDWFFLDSRVTGMTVQQMCDWHPEILEEWYMKGVEFDNWTIEVLKIKGQKMDRSILKEIQQEAKSVPKDWKSLFIQATTLQELKDAYHKIIFQAHPDKGGDAEFFHEVQENYEYFKNKKFS